MRCSCDAHVVLGIGRLIRVDMGSDIHLYFVCTVYRVPCTVYRVLGIGRVFRVDMGNDCDARGEGSQGRAAQAHW